MPKPLDREPTLAEHAVASASNLREQIIRTRKSKTRMMHVAPNQIASDADLAEKLAQCNELLQGLPISKRISYDQSIIDLIDNTRTIETEEIIGQLTNACFPFDRLWIEGPTCLKLSPGVSIRDGYLVTADAKEGSFSFIHTAHMGGEVSEAVKRIKGLKDLFQIGPATPRVSVKDGIDLDEDKLMDGVVRIERVASGEGFKNSHDQGAALIDNYYEYADFLARLFVILGSEHITSNFKGKTPEELELEKKNRERKRMNRLPLLPVTPIEIDVTRINPRFFEKVGTKELRQLLGWTSVRRSKPIVSKYGKVFTRGPHDRRIPAPVDRRDAERQLTATRPQSVLVTGVDNQRPLLKPRHS